MFHALAVLGKKECWSSLYRLFSPEDCPSGVAVTRAQVSVDRHIYQAMLHSNALAFVTLLLIG